MSDQRKRKWRKLEPWEMVKAGMIFTSLKYPDKEDERYPIRNGDDGVGLCAGRVSVDMFGDTIWTLATDPIEPNTPCHAAKRKHRILTADVSEWQKLGMILGNHITHGNSDGGLMHVKELDALIDDILAWRDHNEEPHQSAEIERLTAEVARLEKVIGLDVQLESVAMEPGSAHIQISTELWAGVSICEALADLLHNATNYQELTFDHEAGEDRYVVTVQRTDPGCKTPHQLREEAEAEVARLENAARWIPVSERLPEPYGDPVLVWCDPVGRQHPFAETAYIMTNTDTTPPTHHWSINYVTHWRPIDLPTAETNTLADAIGAWPGDETDDQVQAAIEKRTEPGWYWFTDMHGTWHGPIPAPEDDGQSLPTAEESSTDDRDQMPNEEA